MNKEAVKVFSGAISMLVLFALIAYGWIINIVYLVRCDFDPIGKDEIIRGIGVFVAPLGVILGWFY